MRKFTSVFAIILCTLLMANGAVAKEYAYRLKWLFNASVAGDIYAKEHGFFEKVDLDVEVKEGGPEKNAIRELELGQAHFGVASADQVIIALEKGAKVVVLAQIFQINPMQWIYRAELPEIRVLDDLRGKNIGVTFGGNDESIMNTLLARGNIKKSDVIITSARFDFTPFLTRKVDVWPVYRNSQGVILQDKLAREGEDVRFFRPSDHGVSFVANSVITSEKMIKNNPQVVKNFMEALVAAWQTSMNPAHEQDSLAAIASLDQGNSGDIRKKQLESTRELVMAAPFGQIDVEAWKQTEDIMLRQGQIKKPVNVEAVLINYKEL